MDTSLPDRGNLNTLIIDDDVAIQKLVKGALSQLGVCKVICASEGREALQVVKANERNNEPFNLIICDWEMPVMDGITFLETFRKNNQIAVVIMLTVRTSADDFNKAHKAGADYFFMKPLDTDMLKTRLDAAINAALEKRLKGQNH
jgi:two-component system, chemotaxis family, chemotaxis protein CheY